MEAPAGIRAVFMGRDAWSCPPEAQSEHFNVTHRALITIANEHHQSAGQGHPISAHVIPLWSSIGALHHGPYVTSHFHVHIHQYRVPTVSQ